jgi:hypothetical protein
VLNNNVLEKITRLVKPPYARVRLCGKYGVKKPEVPKVWLYSLLINNYKSICVYIYWNDVIVPGWKVTW